MKVRDVPAGWIFNDNGDLYVRLSRPATPKEVGVLRFSRLEPVDHNLVVHKIAHIEEYCSGCEAVKQSAETYALREIEPGWVVRADGGSVMGDLLVKTARYELTSCFCLQATGCGLCPVDVVVRHVCHVRDYRG